MKSNNYISNLQAAPSNSGKDQRQTSINKGSKRASLFGALLALILFAFTAVPAAQAADLFNNFNSAGVLSGPPQHFTVFVLSQPAQITELETYHWFNGRGTPTSVGNIGIWRVSSAGTPSTMIRAFAAQGVAASFGVIADWVADTNCANPGCFLLAGTYAIADSDPSTWSFNSGYGQHGFSVVRGNFVSAIPAGAIVLTGGPVPAPVPVPAPAMGQPILFTNMNTQGVASGVAAGTGTLFTLKQPASPVQYEISQIATYHYNSAAGAPPGVISIWTTSRRLLFAGNAQGVPGQGGANESWVVNVNPPLRLLPGTYILDDSGHTSWSHNGGSAGCLPFNPSFQCGMGTVYGRVAAAALPTSGGPPIPRPTPTGATFPAKCDVNPSAFAAIMDPCLGMRGSTVTIELLRPVPAPALSNIRFTLVSCQTCSYRYGAYLDNGQPSGPIGVGGLYRVTDGPRLCAMGGRGTSQWIVTIFDGITSYGNIGRFEMYC